MLKTREIIFILAALLLIVADAASDVASAADQRTPLRERDQEIAQALSACSPSVASEAGVYVLGPSGYVKVRDSQNGSTADTVIIVPLGNH